MISRVWAILNYGARETVNFRDLVNALELKSDDDRKRLKHALRACGWFLIYNTDGLTWARTGELRPNLKFASFVIPDWLSYQPDGLRLSAIAEKFNLLGEVDHLIAIMRVSGWKQVERSWIRGPSAKPYATASMPGVGDNTKVDMS